jgi:hypothetical protein
MPTEEIVRSEWIPFFDSFSKRHHNWLTTVEVLSSEIGAQVETRELPLEGITAEFGPGGKDLIQIIAGETPERHAGHVITAPKRVLFKETVAGAAEALEIESAEGETTLIRFRSVIPPELVDGIA